MAIDSTCQTCGKQLRVADEHAGQQARCPNCQTIYTVPEKSPSGAPAAAGSALADSWQVKTPEGLVYGPIIKGELDRWCLQGRITPSCQLLQGGEPQWRWAAEVYPQLREAVVMTPAVRGSPVTPYSPMPLPPGAIYYPKAHRGVLVLVLALLGYVSLCFVVSIVAVVLGVMDLREMKAGRMDPEGRGMTIIGIVLASLWIVGNIGYLILILMAQWGYL